MRHLPRIRILQNTKRERGTPSILLVGNGSYRNRGCEAIVRGTMEVLRSEFGDGVNVRSGVMALPDVVVAQQSQETDPNVCSFSVTQVGPRLSRKWWLSQANKRLGATFQHHVRDLNGHMDGVAVGLEVGGDNYSLEYGRPLQFMAMDNALQASGIPVVIWGASIGPFDKDKAFAASIFEHLSRLDGIFVRESTSLAYLRLNGIEHNVHLVADPAFLMEPEQPQGHNVEAIVREGMIGINLSPLLARFFEDCRDLERWRERASELVTAVAERLMRPVLLVPHVGSPYAADDDFAFLESIHRKVAPAVTVPVDVLPRGYGAAHTKWFIGRCSAFAGARTHATIAALSSCVPTLSLGYSVKAIGINKDLFGHCEFCQSVSDVTPNSFVEGLSRLLCEEAAVHARLSAEIPRTKDRARRAGEFLRGLLRAN